MGIKHFWRMHSFMFTHCGISLRRTCKHFIQEKSTYQLQRRLYAQVIKVCVMVVAVVTTHKPQKNKRSHVCHFFLLRDDD